MIVFTFVFHMHLPLKTRYKGRIFHQPIFFSRISNTDILGLHIVHFYTHHILHENYENKFLYRYRPFQSILLYRIYVYKTISLCYNLS